MNFFMIPPIFGRNGSVETGRSDSREMGSRGVTEESEAEICGHGVESDPGIVMAGSSGHEASPAGHALGQTDAGFNGKAITDILFLFGVQRFVASGLESGTHR